MQTKGTVSLIGLEFFAHHGIYDFEREKGNTFWVDIYLSKHYAPTQLKNLNDTFNYETVFALINNIMQQPEPLIETVAHKIIENVAAAFPTAESILVEIRKNKPPIMGATLNYSAFNLEWHNPAILP